MANDPRTNGEYWVLELAIANAPPGTLTLLDVGANKGDWTARSRECMARHRRAGTTYSFEPTSSTFQFLAQRFSRDRSVRPIPLALSEQPGELTLYVVAELGGTNSLVAGQGGIETRVQVTTVDAFLAQHAIERVTFLKSDTEGNDLAVLRGGVQSLAEAKIDVWQFEYNHRWVYSRSFLRDAFQLIQGKPYGLGKLCRNGIEIFDCWHPELERYFETNFVLIRTGTVLHQLAREFRFGRGNVPVELPRA